MNGMNTIINDSQHLPICEGCPYHWIRVVCDHIETKDGYTEKDFRLLCAHREECERAYYGGESKEY